jgi:swainsonine biosynthesis oxidoreductase SwnR
MKIAVAGAGKLAKYLLEEFKNYGHESVILTRKSKPALACEQRETDYSVLSLVSALQDCDALVSTVIDYQDHAAGTKIHLDMLEACKRSPKCKTLIPAEWTGDAQRESDQLFSIADHRRELHAQLKREKEIRWTVICNAWFAEYVLPASRSYLADIGPMWPMDHATKVFTIYGPGTQLVDFTSARDVAKAVAALLDSKEPWEEYTFLSGQRLTWNDLYALVKKHDPEWTSQTKTLGSSIRQLVANESPRSYVAAVFEIHSYSGNLSLPHETVKRHREKYFQGVHFRTMEELLDAAQAHPNEIV